MAKKISAEDVRDAVVAYYLAHGTGCSVKELSAHASISEGTIRKRLDEQHGLIDGTWMSEEHRESHSTNYNCVSGSHKVWVIYPSRSHLRSLLLAAQGA